VPDQVPEQAHEQPLDPADGALLAAVRAQAEAERAAILSAARARAGELAARGEAELRALRAELTRRFEREMAVERERVVGEAALAAAARELQERRQWIGRVFDAAGSEIAGMAAGPRYPEALARLLAQAAGAAGEGCTLLVREADLALARRIARDAACELRGEGSEPGTAIGVSAGRRVDNSLSSRLAEARRRMEQEVARLLFGDPAP
jgi:vacuolar-type H+-ATPase subunit E/Vma4